MVVNGVGGYYMFVSPSSSSLLAGLGDVYSRGLLISRSLSVPSSSCHRQPSTKCFHLAYHLAGDDVCSLAVKLLSVNDYSLSTSWRRKCDGSDGSWHELELEISESRPFQVCCCCHQHMMLVVISHNSSYCCSAS